MTPIINNLKLSISVLLLILHVQLNAQNLPTSICSPLGGDRANIVSVQSAYRPNNGSAITLTVPMGVTKVLLTISSHSSVIGAPDARQNLGDENFITASIVIDYVAQNSSGILNYADHTNTNGSGTNLYSWINVAFGTFVSTQPLQQGGIGQKTPNLLNDITIKRLKFKIEKMPT